MLNTLIFDMGNVLSDYKCEYVIEKVTNDPKRIELIKNIVFCSSEWIYLDLGVMDHQQALQSILSRISDNKLKEDITYCFNNWPYYNLKINQGIIKVLDYAKDNNMKLYILSNAGDKIIQAADKVIPYYNDFDGVVFSYAIKMIKPQQCIYEYIINKYNINPAKALFIDDLQHNIDAAIKCGLHGYCYKHDDDKLLETIKQL